MLFLRSTLVFILERCRVPRTHGFLSSNGRDLPKFSFLLHLSTKASSTKEDGPPTTTCDPHFMVDYLVAQLGFSREQALAVASKYLTHLKSTDKPDAILGFLKDHGFSTAHMRRIIAGFPKLLCCSSDKLLLPTINLPRPLLNELIVTSPRVLYLRGSGAKLEFWVSFFQGDHSKLLRAFKRTRGIIGHTIHTGISRKLSLLMDLGFSMDDIRLMVSFIPQFISNGIGTMESQIRRTEELGFLRGSKMFIYGLFAVASLKKNTLVEKMGILRCIGWSEEEVLSAILKAPNVLLISEDSFRKKMDFLVEVVGLEKSFIASHPVMLLLSLDKRLVPRFSVLQYLSSKGFDSKRNVQSSLMIPEKKFVEDYLIKYKTEFPNLCYAYATARYGKAHHLCLEI